MVRIALCQLTSTPQPRENLDLVAEYSARAAAEGAEIAVFPEATMACFPTSLRTLAEPLDGPWAQAVRDIARGHGLSLVAGMFTPADGDRVHNTVLITDSDRHLGYDKIHLYDAFGFAESRTVAAGQAPVVVDLGEVRVGVATCYDVRFPELFRVLADQGATVIVLPASWARGAGKLEQWELLVRARALDSTCWVLACGQADPSASGVPVAPGSPTGIGHSLAVDPYGRVCGRLGAAPGLLIVDVDPAVVDQARRDIPVLANRRL